MENKKQRMYFFVNRSLSPIQKGIQAGHCALEYARIYYNNEEYKSFIENDKVWIILDGGTSREINATTFIQGEMEEIVDVLEWASISHATFREPDINYALTAICFLCDERVWEKELYPDYVDVIGMREVEWLNLIGGEKNEVLRNLLKDKHLAN